MGVIFPSEQQGFYTPFQKPVPTPGDESLDDPQTTLCFNVGWQPAILGALKVLTRPETWIGTKADIERTTQSAHMLLGQTGEECNQPSDLCSPVFIGTASGSLECDNTPNFLINLKVCPICEDGSRFWAGHCRPHNTGELCSVVYVFEDVLTGLPSGIHVCSLESRITDVTVGNAWDLAWENCLGEFAVEVGAGDHFLKQDFEVKRFCLSSLAPFMFTIVVDGPILCTEA